jgi:hypothetical protein
VLRRNGDAFGVVSPMMGSTLALLLAVPTCWSERDDPLRAERLAVIAEAIDGATGLQHERAALVTIGMHESSFCWSVASGRVRGGSGTGPWQIEPGSRRKPPFAGTDAASLGHAASQALWLWRHSWQCGRGAADRFRAYAGLSCGSKWAGAAQRARFYGWAVGRLQSVAK